MSQTNADNLIIAYCGLVCSNCGMFVKEKCKGCHSDKPMNRNCSMKACAMKRKFQTCADCQDFDNLHDCKKLDNMISRFFGFIFRSDRIGNLNSIRKIGYQAFRKQRAENGEK